MRITKILQGISSVLLLLTVLLARADESIFPPEFVYLKWGMLAVAVVLMVIVAFRLSRHRRGM